MRQLHTCGVSLSAVDDGVDSTSTTQHRYVLASRETSTMVLEAADEIVEIERPPFVADEATVLAADMADGALTVQVAGLALIGFKERYQLQVCPMSVCAVRDAQQVQLLPLDLAFPVRYASAAEPYIVLLTENNQLLLVDVDANKKQPLSVRRLDELTATTRAAAVCIYRLEII